MKKAPFPEPKQEGMKPIEATRNAAHDSGLKNKEDLTMSKKSTNPAALDKLSDICGRAAAVYAMLDVIREECVVDGRICNAVSGAEIIAKSISDDLYAFRDEYRAAIEMEVAV